MCKLEIRRENGKIYSFIRKKMLIETPEESVRQELVMLLVNEFGYPLDTMEEEYHSDFEGRGVRSTRADIVIYKTKEDKEKNYNAFIVVECKAETVKIRQEDFYQGTEYAAKLRAQFLVLHNSKETNYYAVDLDKIPNKSDAFMQIVTIPRYSDINNEKIVNGIKNQTKTFTRDEFTKMLRTCHNIIRNNDKLSPEAAFDEISKILFMKINFERNKNGAQIFTLEEYKRQRAIEDEYNKNHHIDNPEPFMQTLFKDTKRTFKKDQIFEDSEIIKIRENSFEQILKKLQVYNLSDTQDDIKGIAFEQFLGTTFRGELGQFFTPRTIVDFMVNILDPKEGEVICDPACGSGGFLIKVFEYIREQIEENVKAEKERLRVEIEGKNLGTNGKDIFDINTEIEKMQIQMNRELDTQEKNSRVYKLSHDCIYGTDANPRMARTSKMNMIMHGDGHGGVHHHDGLLNVNGIFEERFDVILTNPPFGSRIDKSQKITDADRFTDTELIQKYRKEYGEAYDSALKQVDDHVGEKLLSLYDVGAMSSLTEVLFIERCLRLLKKGGRMGIVLPEGVLNTSNLQKVREYIEGKAKIILICSIPQDVFIAAGATVKPSLVFLKRFTKQEEKEYARVKEKAINIIHKKYCGEEEKLLSELTSLKEKKKKSKEENFRAKTLRIQLEQLGKKIEEESKPLIKEYFDYEIPMALIEDAGITSTGTASAGNQLPQLQEEYYRYRIKKKLWDVQDNKNVYIFKSDGSIVHNINGIEEQLNG